VIDVGTGWRWRRWERQR